MSYKFPTLTGHTFRPDAVAMIFNYENEAFGCYRLLLDKDIVKMDDGVFPLCGVRAAYIVWLKEPPKEFLESTELQCMVAATMGPKSKRHHTHYRQDLP